MSRSARFVEASLILVLLIGCSSAPVVRVGAKTDTETAILGEVAAQLLNGSGVPARFEDKLGGTTLVWEALRAGRIDVYPEYTGTLRQQIFAGRDLPDDDALRAALAAEGLAMTAPLGFANNYAIGMKGERADALGIRSISDLRRHPGLVLGFSNEFMARADGWPSLQRRYGLPQQNVRGLDHRLAYKSLTDGVLDATDLYTTDAEIARFDLRVLQDDLGHFPAYKAVLLYRLALAERAPAALAVLKRLEGRIDERRMMALNARAQQGVPEARVAAEYLAEESGILPAGGEESVARKLLRWTGQHLVLVGLSLAAAVAVAVPLGVLAAARPRLGQGLLAVTGVLQTVPSLALFALLIPLYGDIGTWPALTALFLYSLLPILRNTYTGLRDIPPALRESAEALGLSAPARLWLVELPLASRLILAGIKTAAVINVGTATLAALIGAGGLGQPIVNGLTVLDREQLLLGAVPVALLALAVQGVFDLAERWLVPRGLRLPRTE
jgi:osmoprotectant transport system permease protein